MPSPAIIDHIESPPAEPRHRSRCIVIRGWAFFTGEPRIEAVRLRGEGITVEGCYGLERPDVKAVHPGANEDCGWQIRACLPRGTYSLAVEYRDAHGKQLGSTPITVEIRPSRMPRWSPWADTEELLGTQFPAHAAYAQRQLRRERYPAGRGHVANLPALAIVTPSFQQSWALGQCMDSVFTNQPPSVQYIVQDGGSTDDSVAVIRARADRLAGWASGPDGGQTNAIALGFEKTSGKPDDLMAWINSDDFYLPGALRFVADYFARHPGVDVLYGNRIVVDREGKEVARWFLPKHSPDVLRLYDFIPQETLFWRRRIWEKVGGLDTAFQFAMDWDLLLRFQAAGAAFVHVPYFLACFRVHAGQKTNALISTQGQAEIDRLRRRTFGRDIGPDEILNDRTLHRYLRASAWSEQLGAWGIRIG